MATNYLMEGPYASYNWERDKRLYYEHTDTLVTQPCHIVIHQNLYVTITLTICLHIHEKHKSW